MIFLFYGVLLIGLILLILDVAGRFRARTTLVRLLKGVGLTMAAIPALVPLAAVYGNWWAWSGPTFPTIAHVYTVLSAAYIAGVLFGAGVLGRWVSRGAYLGLLALAAFPSFVLLPITAPTVGLAGLALARRWPQRVP